MIEQFYLTQRWDPNSFNWFRFEEIGNNGNEEVLHIPQSSRIGASLSNGV